jgi:transcriptional regulator GlxA family with amidase domain
MPDMKAEHFRHLAVAAQPAYDVLDGLLERIPTEFEPCIACLRRRLFDRKLAVADVKAAGGTRGYEFPRAFRAAYGERPSQFLSNQRLETAQRLLRTTDLPVGVIARLVGFAGIHAFGMRFRHVFGHSASEYRQEHRPAAVAADSAG